MGRGHKGFVSGPCQERLKDGKEGAVPRSKSSATFMG
jgi:hypothetical protein